MKSVHQYPKSSTARCGAALVELAICLPILLIITFGSIEAANSISLKQALTEVAYEAARIAVAQGRTEQDARTRATEILAARNIDNATVEISPKIKSTTKPGTEVTVTISAPAESGSVAPQWYFRGTTMSATVVMVRL
ncbi:MAG: pilus assembly protein [Planctomycetaceae bacterium]|nr:pilus assembly protein [Planctomycetaceae bacterium]